jgi:hypothetical protein
MAASFVLVCDFMNNRRLPSVPQRLRLQIPSLTNATVVKPNAGTQTSFFAAPSSFFLVGATVKNGEMSGNLTECLERAFRESKTARNNPFFRQSGFLFDRGT